MSAKRQRVGRKGEEIAAARLARDGARVVQRNARTRYGEIDIVALEGSTLAFVEVKTLAAGSIKGPTRPVLAVGPSKQARLRRLASAWLAERPPLPWFEGMRFDVIGIRLDSSDRVVEYEHLRAAF